MQKSIRATINTQLCNYHIQVQTQTEVSFLTAMGVDFNKKPLIGVMVFQNFSFFLCISVKCVQNIWDFLCLLHNLMSLVTAIQHQYTF